MSRLRYGKRFSNTGLGQTPTLTEVYGLTRSCSRKAKYYQELAHILKKRAMEGDTKSATKYKKLMAARSKAYQPRKAKPTQVKLSFLEREIP